MTEDQRRRGRRERVVFFAIAALLVAADLLTKSWLFAGEGATASASYPIPGTGGLLAVHTVLNTGIPWGMFSGNLRALAVVSSLAVIGILAIFLFQPCHGSWRFVSGLALILGGALGNLHDRALLPGVRDWIAFVPELPLIGHWPVFNLADSGICVGAGLIGLTVFFPGRAAAPGAPEKS